MLIEVDLNPYNLNDFTEYLNADYTNPSSCIQHQTTEQKDIHDQYGGFPETYNFDNTIINQIWWDKNDFAKLGEALKIDIQSASTIMQPPGCVIPIHKDEFFVIKKENPERCKKEMLVRANIFLEDWKMGHFLQYDDEVCTHWKAGQGITWNNEHLHLSVNAGLENKYTMQLSGFSTVWRKID